MSGKRTVRRLTVGAGFLASVVLAANASSSWAAPAEEPAVLNAPADETAPSWRARPIKKPTPRKAAVAAQPLQPSPDAPTVLVRTNDQRPDIKDLVKDKCFAVDIIEIKGVDLIDPQAIEKAIKPLAYNCLGNELAKNIIGAINKTYSDHGYVTTQGYVATGQNIAKSRRFVVNVIVGRVGAIHYKESDGNESFSDSYKRTKDAKNPWQFVSGLSGMWSSLDGWLDRFQILDGQRFDTVKRWMTMPVGERDPLQLDLVQQGLDQMNKAQSGKASVKLEAGAEPGTSNVVITNPMQDSFRVLLGYEINGGSLNGLAGTTSDRYRIDVAKDNLIGINDTWAGSIASGRDSNELRGTVSVPVRWWTFSFSQGYSESMQVIGDSVAEYYMRTFTSSLTASYLVWRTKDLQITLDSSLSYRRKDRFIDSLNLLPQTVPSARIGTSLIKKLENQQITAGIGVSHGLSWWDSTKDARDADYATPRAQYWKIDGSLGYQLAVEKIGIFKADITGQWTQHPLFQDDQITMGSPSTVRGFANSAVTIDRGFVLRTEYAPAIPYDKFLDMPKDDKTEPGFLASVLSPLQPYLFADYGYGQNIAERTDIARAGIGGGLRYRYGRLTFDVAGAVPVYREGLLSVYRDGLRVKPKTGPEVYLTLSVKAF